MGAIKSRGLRPLLLFRDIYRYFSDSVNYDNKKGEIMDELEKLEEMFLSFSNNAEEALLDALNKQFPEKVRDVNEELIMA